MKPQSALATLILTVLLAAAGPVQARELRLATWNLGWHLDTALAKTWREACGQTFAKDGADGLWRPSAQGTQTGWQLRWGRNAPIEWDISRLPPCDVYQARFRPVAVTEAAHTVRLRQIREILERDVAADILAFQEVSGRQAVLDVLPQGGAGYEVCSYEGHKVQRLAIAWRTALGTRVSCEPHWPLSLPAQEPRDQPRPGLALTLRVDGRLLRVLTVHLKSSCVSPLDRDADKGRGQLDGDEPNCRVLREQVAPLEAWIEQQAEGVAGLVLMGDYNRNVSHESREAPDAPVRLRGDPTDPHTPSTRVRNLWRDVNDGRPKASALRLLESRCEGDPAIEALCEKAKAQPLAREETAQLAAVQGLGCRNPTGLVHIAVSAGLEGSAAKKIALGVRGRTLEAGDRRPDPLLAVSDHCPVVATVRLAPR